MIAAAIKPVVWQRSVHCETLAGAMTTRNNEHLETVAGGGLLDRRLFLSSSVGAAGLSLLRARPADAFQRDVPSWMKAPGEGLRPYGERSKYESAVQRIVAPVTGTTGSGSSRSPLEHFEGIITPSSLHFERHHSGVPDIPPGG